MIKRFLFLIAILFSAGEIFAQKVIVDTQPTLQDRFGKKAGNIRFSTMTVKVGRILNNESRMDTVRMFNEGVKALHLSLAKVPSHIEAHLSSMNLPPKTEGWLSLRYDASKINDYGFIIDHFEIVTNDSVIPVKVINTTANIIEYFPPMTTNDSLIAQKARSPLTSYDYGKIKQGDKVTNRFMLINDGKRDLIVRKVQSSCNCLKNTLSKNTLAAGDTTFITADFDSKNKEGKDSRKLNVFLNDPFKPEWVFEMKGEIIK